MFLEASELQKEELPLLRKVCEVCEGETAADNCETVHREPVGEGQPLSYS